jgi:L-threonylcarbamoyladenylate synthase
MKKEDWNQVHKSVIPILRLGGIGVFPTDTLYGLVGSALDKETVERMYVLRKRDPEKPMIILISSLDDLKKFGIILDSESKKRLKEFWPGMVSVIFECKYKRFAYLHRNKKTLAFRFPSEENLRKFLKKTGPLVAPSANLAGKEPAKTYLEARNYFHDEVDFYVDGGTVKSKPSTLISMDKNGEITILRHGGVKIAKIAKTR